MTKFYKLTTKLCFTSNKVNAPKKSLFSKKSCNFGNLFWGDSALTFEADSTAGRVLERSFTAKVQKRKIKLFRWNCQYPSGLFVDTFSIDMWWNRKWMNILYNCICIPYFCLTDTPTKPLTWTTVESVKREQQPFNIYVIKVVMHLNYGSRFIIQHGAQEKPSAYTIFLDGESVCLPRFLVTRFM